MRITHGMMQENLLRNVQRNMRHLAEAQASVSSGKRLQFASDDPVAAAKSLRASHGLRTIAQHRRNTNAARIRLTTEEAVLDQVTDILARGRELAIAMGSDTADAPGRLAAAAEVGQMIEQVIQLGNTVVDDEYVFAGHQSDTPPFQTDGSYVGDLGLRETEIGSGYRVTMSHNGAELLVDSDIIAGLRELETALNANDRSAVQASLTTLTDAFANSQSLLSETGARLRQIDVALENLDALDSNFTATKADAEEVDIEEAALELASAQTALEAALAATAQALRINVTEYLR
jgi:flagellar hook-associated protein 3 FlgL